MTTNADAPTLTSPQASWKDALSGNARIVIAAAIVVILATLVYSIYATRSQERQQQAQSALYQAQKLVLNETPKIKKPAPALPAGANAKTTPPPAPIEEPAENAKYDVDATMPGSVKALTAVATEFAKSRAGFDAALMLGDLYQRHGEPAKAAPWYAKASEIAPDSLGRALATSAQGYAFEESGKLPEALQAFTKVSNSGEASLKGDALMAVARVHEAKGDKAQAVAVYDQIIAQMPNTDTAKAAETLKLQLGGQK